MNPSGHHPASIVAHSLLPDQIRLDPLRKFLRTIEGVPKRTYAVDGSKVFVFEKLVSLMSKHPLMKMYQSPVDEPRWGDNNYQRLVNTALVLVPQAWIEAEEAVTIWGIQPNGYRIESTAKGQSVYYLRHQRLSVALPVAFASLKNAQHALANLLLGRPVTIELPGARYLTEDDLFVFALQAANIPRTVYQRHAPTQPLVLLAEYTAAKLPPLPELPAIARVHLKDRVETPCQISDSNNLLSEDERLELIAAVQRWTRAANAVLDCAQFNRQACIDALSTNQSTQALRAHQAATDDLSDLRCHHQDAIRSAGAIIATCSTDEESMLAGSTFGVALLSHSESAEAMAWTIKFLQHGKHLLQRLEQAQQLATYQATDSGPIPIVVIDDLG